MPATPKPVVVNDRQEEADDLAEHEAPVVGAATQALYDKKLLRAQVLAEQTAKLRAIELGTYAPEPMILPPVKPARARMSKVEPAAVKPASKPRKSVKKAEQA